MNELQQNLIDYTLHLADNALILGHRNSEWCGHGPVLEQDIAITNISLDLIGQARNFYQYAAVLKGGDRTEDDFAYFRDAPEFRNVLLVELPKGDWAFTTLRQFFFSSYQLIFFSQLGSNADQQLAAIATKSLKEIQYHLRWSSEWVIRLGDGTDESHKRIAAALDQLWSCTHELFLPAPYETEMVRLRLAPDPRLLREQWIDNIKPVLLQAELNLPDVTFINAGGKEGRHTPHLQQLLTEMQSVARAYPEAKW